MPLYSWFARPAFPFALPFRLAAYPSPDRGLLRIHGHMPELNPYQNPHCRTLSKLHLSPKLTLWQMSQRRFL